MQVFSTAFENWWLGAIDRFFFFPGISYYTNIGEHENKVHTEIQFLNALDDKTELAVQSYLNEKGKRWGSDLRNAAILLFSTYIPCERLRWPYQHNCSRGLRQYVISRRFKFARVVVLFHSVCATYLETKDDKNSTHGQVLRLVTYVGCTYAENALRNLDHRRICLLTLQNARTGTNTYRHDSGIYFKPRTRKTKRMDVNGKLKVAAKCMDDTRRRNLLRYFRSLKTCNLETVNERIINEIATYLMNRRLLSTAENMWQIITFAVNKAIYRCTFDVKELAGYMWYSPLRSGNANRNFHCKNQAGYLVGRSNDNFSNRHCIYECLLNSFMNRFVFGAQLCHCRE